MAKKKKRWIRRGSFESYDDEEDEEDNEEYEAVEDNDYYD